MAFVQLKKTRVAVAVAALTILAPGEAGMQGVQGLKCVPNFDDLQWQEEIDQYVHQNVHGLLLRHLSKQRQYKRVVKANISKLFPDLNWLSHRSLLNNIQDFCEKDHATACEERQLSWSVGLINPCLTVTTKNWLVVPLWNRHSWYSIDRVSTKWTFTDRLSKDLQEGKTSALAERRFKGIILTDMFRDRILLKVSNFNNWRKLPKKWHGKAQGLRGLTHLVSELKKQEEKKYKYKKQDTLKFHEIVKLLKQFVNSIVKQVSEFPGYLGASRNFSEHPSVFKRVFGRKLRRAVVDGVTNACHIYSFLSGLPLFREERMKKWNVLKALRDFINRAKEEHEWTEDEKNGMKIEYEE